MNKSNYINRYMVLLVDRKRVIMFTIKAGRASKRVEYVNGQVPQRVKTDEEHFYGRTDKIARHIEDHLHRDLLFVSGHAKTYWKKQKYDGLIIGTHKPLYSKIEKHLPAFMKKHVKEKFVTELKAPFGDILKVVRTSVKDMEKKIEIQAYENYFLNQ